MPAAAGSLDTGRCCNRRQKSRWVGRFWWDLWYFSINTNPILALCLSHPLHPVGRKERYAISAMQVRSEPSRSPFVLALPWLICHLVSNHDAGALPDDRGLRALRGAGQTTHPSLS